MGALREYVRAVAKTWWTALGVVGGVLGLISALSGADVPRWVWLSAVVGGVLFAQFSAFRRVISERDALRPAATDQPAEAGPNLAGGLFDARSTNPSLRHDDAGLVIRALALVRGATQRTEMLDSGFEARLRASLEGSPVARWLAEHDATGSALAWHAVDPTRSTVVTLQSTDVEVGPSFTVFTRSFAALTGWPHPPGWLEACVDIVFRPSTGWDAFTTESHRATLSLPEIHRIFGVLLTTVDELTSRLSEAVFDRPAESIGPLVDVWANYAPMTAFVDWGDFERATGAHSTDPSHIVLSGGNRNAEIKKWLARTLRNNGYSGYEPVLERLAPL